MPLSSAYYRIGAVSAGGTHKDKKYILAEILTVIMSWVSLDRPYEEEQRFRRIFESTIWK